MNFKLKLKISGLIAVVFIIMTTLQPTLAQAPEYIEPDNSAPTEQTTNNRPVIQVPEATTVKSQESEADLYGSFAPDTPKDITTISQGAMYGMVSSLLCVTSGVNPFRVDGKCLETDPATGKLTYMNTKGQTALVMGTLLGGTMNIPISSADYVQYAVGSFGPGKAYAQTNGIGFDRLRPLIKVWTRFRDIAYLAFVLVFTVIGLAIMFRVKIDARTVMTIQNQIPRIIIGILLVTFSFAIAGFLIDMMYVIMYLIILTFSGITNIQINPDSSIFGVFNKAFSPDVPSYLDSFGGGFGTGNIAYSVGTSGIMNIAIEASVGISSVFSALTVDFLDSTISNFFKIPFIPFSVVDIGCSFVSGFLEWGTPLGWLGKVPGLGDALGKIPGFNSVFGGSSCNFVDTFFRASITALFASIVFLVVLIAIIFNLFRVWFTLIKSFVYVLVDSMIGPLWIAAGIFPGSKLNFASWIKHLMGHLSVFPMTFAVILLGKTIMDGVKGGGSLSALTGGAQNTGLFSPPLVGDAFGGNATVAAFIGLGFILSLHHILSKTREAIGAMDFGLKDLQATAGAGVGAVRKAQNQYGAMAKEKRTLEPNTSGTGPAWIRPEWGTVIRRRFGSAK